MVALIYYFFSSIFGSNVSIEQARVAGAKLNPEIFSKSKYPYGT